MKKDILVQQLVNSFGNWVRTDCENRAGGTARMTRDLYPYTTPRAVDRPTAGSASMAKIRASGCVSVKSRTKAADSDVLPTPPLPATARILGFLFNRASRPFWAVCIYMHAVLYKVSGR